MPARVYFDAEDGTAYRVYDTQLKHGITKRVPLGDPHAKYRIFVPQNGARRSHMFLRGESHGLQMRTSSGNYGPLSSFMMARRSMRAI